METMPRDLNYILERIQASQSVIKQAHERKNAAGSSLSLWEIVPSEVQRLFLSTFEIDFEILQYPGRLSAAYSSELAPT